MNQIPAAIQCAKCGRPVEEVITWSDDFTYRLMFRVRCHGEEDTGWLDAFDLASAGPIHAVAFRTDRLTTSATPPEAPEQSPAAPPPHPPVSLDNPRR